MLEMHLRQAANILLHSAIQIAPPEVREWGQAMQCELAYVEGPWTAMRWAVGGASVLASHALASFLIPGRGQGTAPDGGIFAKSPALSKAALITGGVCVLVALLFFAAPPFRQAFQVALRPWFFMYQVATRDFQPGIESLALRAEKAHDPDGLAFCAVRIRNAAESARLAEQAARRDPDLRWIYAIIALRHPELSETGRWVEELKQWDPQNALLPLITAGSIVRLHFPNGVWSPPSAQQDEMWRTAMASAFESPKFDDYLDRFAALNRKVVSQYRFYDPYEAESPMEVGLPEPTVENCERYAYFLIRAGQKLEARGDLNAARQKYWTLARFGQLIDAQGHTAFEHQNGAYLQSLAYRPLKALSARQGNAAEAELFGYLAEKFNPTRKTNSAPLEGSAFGRFTSHRNAAVVEISGLMILVFSGLGIIAGMLLLFGSLPGARPATQRAKPMATMVAFTSAIGLLFSSVTLYLTYRPYWYIFQSTIENGNGVQSSDLYEFLNSAQMPPGVSPQLFRRWMEALIYSGSPSFLFFVWAGVILLCLSALVVIVLRRFLGRQHAHSP